MSDREAVLAQWDRLIARRKKFEKESKKCTKQVHDLLEKRKELNKRVRAVRWVMRYIWGNGRLYPDESIDEEIEIQAQKDKGYRRRKKDGSD